MVSLQVKGRKCLVVGSGSEAVRYAKLLQQAGAIVQLAGRPDSKMDGLAVHPAGYDQSLLQGAALVVAVVADNRLAERIIVDCRRHGVWLFMPARPDSSNLQILPSARAGAICAAVMAQPASLGEQIVGEIAREILPRHEPFARVLEETQQLASELPQAEQRMRFMAELASPESRDIFQKRGPAHWRNWAYHRLSYHAAASAEPEPEQ